MWRPASQRQRSQRKQTGVSVQYEYERQRCRKGVEEYIYVIMHTCTHIWFSIHDALISITSCYIFKINHTKLIICIFGAH